MIYKLSNIDDIQRETGVSVVKRVRVIGYNNVCRYRLLEDIRIQVTSGDILTIKSGFEWDLSSTPRPLWWLLPPDSDAEIAMVIHDYLYQIKPYGKNEKARWFSDLEMYKWSVVTNGTYKLISIRNIDNLVRYLGVVIFGWWEFYKVFDKIKGIFKKRGN